MGDWRRYKDSLLARGGERVHKLTIKMGKYIQN
jgi:hypothetical protein